MITPINPRGSSRLSDLGLSLQDIRRIYVRPCVKFAAITLLSVVAMGTRMKRQIFKENEWNVKSKKYRTAYMDQIMDLYGDKEKVKDDLQASGREPDRDCEDI